MVVAFYEDRETMKYEEVIPMLTDIAQTRITSPKSHPIRLDIDDVIQSIKQTNREIEKIFFKNRPLISESRIVSRTTCPVEDLLSGARGGCTQAAGAGQGRGLLQHGGHRGSGSHRQHGPFRQRMRAAQGAGPRGGPVPPGMSPPRPRDRAQERTLSQYQAVAAHTV